MSTVFASLGMSLDGFIAGPFDGVSPTLGLEPARVVSSPRVTHLGYLLTAP
ncbi:hypothetical protein [Streptomyces sp. NPDC048590]|uniref:hypothetical protein n=1 Tax=Streptomyces sp. NPDC048590 TaxID=3365574 RepID=UPI00371953DE